MKITFIESTRYLKTGGLLKAKTLVFPSLTFPLLAALTPGDCEVSIVNEIFDDVDFGRPTDLVGLTAITTNVYRAYEIADAFRRRRVPVVMGGVHASMVPDEAAEHADTVIVGEAEETWPRFLADFRNGRAKPRYRPERPPSLAHLPVPRWDLVNRDHYLSFKFFRRIRMTGAYVLQTSRGCNFSCDYCSTRHFTGGGGFRPRPIGDVIAEIRALGARRLFLVDDNLFASPSHAKELFRALIPLRLTWGGQGTLGAGEDAELVDLARRSGCRFLIAGLESINPAVLGAVRPRDYKFGEYERCIRTFRRAGIDLEVSMMFGFDQDDASVFEKACDFLIRNRVPYTSWLPRTPFPGTELYRRLEAEGRLKYPKWWLQVTPAMRQDIYGLLFTGTTVDEAEFSESFYRQYKRFHSPLNIVRRVAYPPTIRAAIAVLVNLSNLRKISTRATVAEH